MRAQAHAVLAPLALFALAALVAGAVPALADEVHLLNGKSFEDVVARVEGDEVAIGLSGGGEIVLSMDRVARVVQSDTTIEAFRERAQELTADPDAGAAEWLALARWAEERGLRPAYRDAALEAARREPELPGVAAAMRELGYVFDPAYGGWLPQAELMARRGLVPFRGDWVTAEERDRRILAASEYERELARDRRLERITRILETQVELELVRGLAQSTQQPAPSGAYATAPVYGGPAGYPIYVVPGFSPHHGHGHHKGPSTRAPRSPRHGPRSGPPPAALPPPSHHRSSREPVITPVDFTDFIPGRLNPEASPPPGQLGVR